MKRRVSKRKREDRQAFGVLKANVMRWNLCISDAQLGCLCLAKRARHACVAYVDTSYVHFGRRDLPQLISQADGVVVHERFKVSGCPGQQHRHRRSGVVHGQSTEHILCGFAATL